MNFRRQFVNPFTIGFAAGLVTAEAFVAYVGTIPRVDGRSMQPTFYPPQDLNKTAFRRYLPEYVLALFIYNRDQSSLARLRGNIVVVEHPRNEHVKLVKRCIAIPGDEIRPLTFGNKTSETTQIVPKNHVWIESDNGFGYSDSSVFGPVHVSKLQAQAVCIVFPWKRIKRLKPDLSFADGRLNCNIDNETALL